MYLHKAYLTDNLVFALSLLFWRTLKISTAMWNICFFALKQFSMNYILCLNGIFPKQFRVYLLLWIRLSQISHFPVNNFNFMTNCYPTEKRNKRIWMPLLVILTCLDVFYQSYSLLALLDFTLSRVNSL